jgi:hypothetical protein
MILWDNGTLRTDSDTQSCVVYDEQIQFPSLRSLSELDPRERKYRALYHCSSAIQLM